MAGFFNFDLLRAQEAPRFPWDDGTAARSGLVARWGIASDGRPVCDWIQQERFGFGPAG